MICPNCGAEYLDSELNCPYCGGENRGESERRFQGKLKKYDKEAEEIRKLPKKIVRKSTRRLIIAGWCIAVLAIIVIVTVFGISQYKVSVDFKDKQKHISQLELYLEGEQYTEMYEYIADFELLGSSYQKYREVAYAYFSYGKLCNEVEELKNSKDTAGEDAKCIAIRTIIQYAVDALSVSKDAVEDPGILGNEDILQSLDDKICDMLKRELYMTGEEIERLSAAEDKKALLKEMTEFIYERIR